jgi:hypothetical protein
MWMPFSELPDAARIWLYQTDRPLTDSEIPYVQQVLDEQVARWAAHGQPLTGSARVLHGRFVVLAVDETQHGPSGCSIDASTHWFKELGAQLGLSFFDRSVAYLDEAGTVRTLPVAGVKAAVAAGEIRPDTLVFNPLVPTLGAWKQDGQVPAAKSWLKRYFQPQTA